MVLKTELSAVSWVFPGILPPQWFSSSFELTSMRPHEVADFFADCLHSLVNVPEEEFDAR